MRVLVSNDSPPYCVTVTLDDWSKRVTRTVAREIRRYRDERKLSAQQLSDLTGELGMEVPRSVLANLESGRRDTISAAEVAVLAAALGVSPIELLCPVGWDEQTEILPGRMMDPLSASRWFAGEFRLVPGDGTCTIRRPEAGEESSIYLIEYHEELLARLRTQEAEAAMAVADATVEGADERARGEASYRLQAVEQWREFIREPLLRTRQEMRARGMILPPLPESLKLDDDRPGMPDAGGETA